MVSRSFNLLLIIVSDATKKFGGENSVGTSKVKGKRKRSHDGPSFIMVAQKSEPCVVEYIMTTCIFPYFPKRTKK